MSKLKLINICLFCIWEGAEFSGHFDQIAKCEACGKIKNTTTVAVARKKARKAKP